MKNNKLIIILKSIIIILISIIILQNLGLLINKQNKLKAMIRNTEMYINGTISKIDDLINLNINDNSSVEDIETFNQLISFCKSDMLLGDFSMRGYRINIDYNLITFDTYASEHDTILDRIAKDQQLKVSEKEYLKLFKKELTTYSLELKKLQDKKFISIKEINNITSNFDITYKHDSPQPFFYIEKYEDFINKFK